MLPPDARTALVDPRQRAGAPADFASAIPAVLSSFIAKSCRIPSDALQIVPADRLPEPDQRLLVHPHDMTSTLSAFHGSPLRVEVLQAEQRDGCYLREVFLRTARAHRMVEYGVIAIALGEFSAAPREEILAGRTPLGGVLHRFAIPFESAPLHFVAVSSDQLAASAFAAPGRPISYGRFNRLARPGGAPLAWILELLPHA